MEVTEFQDGGTRCVCWQLPNQGWSDLSEKLDDYLAECFRTIAATYSDKQVAWVELNFWPDNRLIVFPSDEGPFGDRNERICFQLFSGHLQRELDRIRDMVNEHKQGEWGSLGKQLWDRVGECLTNGKGAPA